MQSRFSELEYGARTQITRRDRFLADLEVLTPLSRLLEEFEPFYPKGKRVRLGECVRAHQSHG